MHDLLRQQPAVPAAFAQTRAQPDDAKGVALAGDRADQRRAVDGIGDRAVDDRVNADLLSAGIRSNAPSSTSITRSRSSGHSALAKFGSIPSMPQVLQSCS